MAKKKKIEPLSEKEKEQLRLIIPFDKAKIFITNLNAIFDASEEFQEWEINHKSLVLKSTSLKMEFLFKDSAIDKVIEELDKGQKKLGEFLDPDKVPEGELEVNQ